jgi:hypothetical protein
MDIPQDEPGLTGVVSQIYRCYRHRQCQVLATSTITGAHTKPRYAMVGLEADTQEADCSSEYWHYLDRPETFAR